MSDDSANPSFDAAVFEVILIALFGTCFALEMGIMIIVDWGLGECMAEKCGATVPYIRSHPPPIRYT